MKERKWSVRSPPFQLGNTPRTLSSQPSRFPWQDQGVENIRRDGLVGGAEAAPLVDLAKVDLVLLGAQARIDDVAGITVGVLGRDGDGEKSDGGEELHGDEMLY